jgi:hypothetical protein
MDMTDPIAEPAAAPMAEPRRRRGALRFLALPLIAFLIGLAAMAWILTRWEKAAEWIGVRPAPQPQAAAPAPPPSQAQPLPSAPADPALADRLAQLEQRVAAIDTQSRAAVGNADRAEGLLVAFAARRALDRGVALGYIEGLLRQRFGQSQPQAVGTIITAARQPVTLQELREDLQDAGPSLTGTGPEQNWWTAFKAELGNIITVRKSGTPSTVPTERLARALQRLEAGQVDVALAEILRLPGRNAAGSWIADARRYVAARRALDAIETAALLEPRSLTTAPAPVAPPQAAPVPVPPGA